MVIRNASIFDVRLRVRVANSIEIGKCLNDAGHAEQGIECDSCQGHGLRRLRNRFDVHIVRSENNTQIGA